MKMDKAQPQVPGLDQEQVEILISWASATPRITTLAIFGSRARGDHTDDSDVDLIIALSEGRHETASGLWICKKPDWNAALTEALGLEVRLVRPTYDDDGGIAQGIESDAITLFQRS